MFIVLKNKLNKILCYLLTFTILFVANSVIATESVSATPSNRFSVVIDAGHGGIDGGCVGKSNVYESEITLAISKKLQKYLEALNIDVVQTRENSDGLYGSFANGFKMRDMQARAQIIKKANPNLVISIHANAFSDTSCRGAQVFFAPDSRISKEFGISLQQLFIKNLVEAKKSPLLGDFYILKCSSSPGILVECGFLSNSEEEKLLISKEYQDKIAYNICCGIVSYFDLTKF